MKRFKGSVLPLRWVRRRLISIPAWWFTQQQTKNSFPWGLGSQDSGTKVSTLNSANASQPKFGWRSPVVKFIQLKFMSHSRHRWRWCTHLNCWTGVVRLIKLICKSVWLQSGFQPRWCERSLGFCCGLSGLGSRKFRWTLRWNLNVYIGVHSEKIGTMLPKR